MKSEKQNSEFRQKWIELIKQQQEAICKSIELCDGKSLFSKDEWKREGGKGGGGFTRVIEKGNVFEKGGVNTSVVYGEVTNIMRQHLAIESDYWFACGISIVLHPVSPLIPTIHCNYRMFELYDKDNKLIDRWFGGGTDLTPYYPYEEDAVHFHNTYKEVCNRFDTTFYPQFKKQCDDYFTNTHRNNERRGIGGIFYDKMRPTEKQDSEFWLSFSKSCSEAFLTSYLPIVNKRKTSPYTDQHKYWQEIRRGRYTEFNLIHDKGTLFGLKTDGRTESILMSLPPTVRFEYDYQPAKGSDEDKLLQVCLNPKSWA